MIRQLLVIAAFLGVFASISSGQVNLPILGNNEEIIIGLGSLFGPNPVDISSSGKYIAAGSMIGAYLWDLQSGQMAQHWLPHGSVHSIEISPDEKVIYIGADWWDGTQWDGLWDIQTHTKIFTFSKIGSQSYSSSFSPDGTQIAVGSGDGVIRIYDPSGYKQVKEIAAHPENVTSLKFFPDGNRLISASGGFDTPNGDTSAKVWNTETGNLLYEIKGHTSPVTGVDIAKDGSYLVTADQSGAIRLWEPENGTLKTTFTDPSISQISSVRISPDGKSVLVGDVGTAKIWDVQSKTILRECTSGSGWSYFVDYAPDGNSFVSTSHGGDLVQWNAQNGQAIHKYDGFTNWVFETRFSKDLKYIYTSGQFVRRWEIAKGIETKRYDVSNGWTRSMDFSPDEKWFVCDQGWNPVQVDTESGNVLRSYEGHSGEVRSVDVSADGSRMLSGGCDGTVRLWDTVTGRRIWTLNSQSGCVYSVSISSDGGLGLAGSESKLTLWNLQTGQEEWASDFHQGKVYEVLFSPSGKTFLSGGFDKKVILWDAVTRSAIKTFEIEGMMGFDDDAASVSGLAFAPDESLLFVSTIDGTSVLSPYTGQEVKRYQINPSSQSDVTVSADGNYIAVASHDGTVRILALNSSVSIGRLLTSVLDFMLY